MMSLILINRYVVVYMGLVLLIMGLFGSIMLTCIFISVPFYRKTPCTFYFIIASIHDCGQLITALGPLIFASGLDIDMTLDSVVWCKLRYFFASSFAATSATCVCLTIIDQYVNTSHNLRVRLWSNIKNAQRVSLYVIIIWWLHGTLWFYFQDKSPITNTCVFRVYAFFVYSVFFMCIMLCLIPTVIMGTFGILTYRNIRTALILVRHRVDRHLIMMVFNQVLLTLIGLSPYSIHGIYSVITIDAEKSADRKAIESLTCSIAYLFGSLTYGVSIL